MFSDRLLGAEFRARLMSASDWLAVAVMGSLPWSTSATAIFIALWTIAVLPTLDWPLVRERLTHPALYLPLLICTLLALGMLWADAVWSERWGAVRHLVKLLLIPLLIIHFSRSQRGFWTLGGFITSCTVLLLYSWASLQWPWLVWGVRLPGVPVKDYIYQNVFFVLSACMLLHISITCVQRRQNAYAALTGLLALLFVANIVYAVTSRSSMLALPIMTALIGYQRFGVRGLFTLLVGLVVFSIVAWTTSPHFRERMISIVHFKEQSQITDPKATASEALRLAYWKGSVSAIAEKPFTGHGSGSIREVLVQTTSGETAKYAAVVANPHNQILALGIQLGIPGIAALLLMWLSHIFLFTGDSLTARFGVLVVVQNIINSAFNSHLSDFTAGWLYVFGVGILGGIVLRKRSRPWGWKNDSPQPDLPRNERVPA